MILVVYQYYLSPKYLLDVTDVSILKNAQDKDIKTEASYPFEILL